MEQKTSGYGNQQLTSKNPVGKEPAATATQPAAVADSTKKLNVKENSPTQKVEELQNQLEDTKDAFETGVKEILKDELGVSDEQVEDAMSILGLQWMDLLNPASLSQLVTQLTGTEDACSLLMSEEFTNIMQNTDALVQNLSETLGISKDEWVALQNQLAELTADFNETVDMQMAAYRKWLHRLMRQLLQGYNSNGSYSSDDPYYRRNTECTAGRRDRRYNAGNSGECVRGCTD